MKISLNSNGDYDSSFWYSHSFTSPVEVEIDQNINVYISEVNSHCIKKISDGGSITFAGMCGNSGDEDKDKLSSKFNMPRALLFDKNYEYLYVYDDGNKKIKRISMSTGNVTTYAGNGNGGCPNNNVDKDSLNIEFLDYMAFDSKGNLYYSNYNCEGISRIDAKTGIVKYIAGDPGTIDYGIGGDGLQGTNGLHNPMGIVFNKYGELIVNCNDQNMKKIVYTES